MPESSASTKTLAERLLIRPGYRVFILNPPRGYRTALRPIPEGAQIFTEPQEDLDMIQLFITCKEELQAELARRKNLLKPNGLLWVMFPKGGARLKGDINRDVIDAYAQTVGLKGVSIVSVDDKWSAVRLRIHQHQGGEVRGEDVVAQGDVPPGLHVEGPPPLWRRVINKGQDIARARRRGPRTVE